MALTRNRLGVLSSVAALIAAWPAALGAQESAPKHWYIERAVHERWMTPDQRPDQVPFVDTLSRYRIDSVVDHDGARTFHLTTGNYLFGSFTVDAAGRAAQFGGGTRGLPAFTSPGSADRDAKLRMWEDFLHNRIGMPQARVWDIATSFHPAARSAGSAWFDTLDFNTEQVGFRQMLRGVRRSVILRDTVVSGRTMYWVHDSADVSYLERFLPVELGEPHPSPIIERATSGTITGTSLYDPEIRLFSMRRDTTRLGGNATRSYASDPVLRTPIMYLRTRQWSLIDSAGTAAHIAAQRATAAGARSSRPAAVSMTPAARRDSMIALVRRLIVLGDTVAAFGALDAQFDGQLGAARPIDVEGLQLILPVLADRQRAFSRDLDYLGMFYGLVRHLTGAIPAITADTAKWACVPAGCAYLASQWEKATDRRLRNLGLVAHFVTQPARWAGMIDKRAKVDSEFLDEALMLRRGVATTWPAGSHAAMPPRGAPWPAWVEWMNGHNPAYPVSVLPNRTPPPARLDVRFGPTHVIAVQMYQVVSGRNIIAEWQQQLATATDDSARLAFRTMLIGMNAYHGDASDIAARVLDTNAVVRSSAVKEVFALFGPPGPIPSAPQMLAPPSTAPLADSATTFDIQDRLLSMALDHMPSWPPLPPGPRTGAVRGFTSVEAQRPGDSVVVIGRDLGPGVRAKWRTRALFGSDTTFRDVSARAKATYFRPSAVRQVGPFVQVTLDYGFDSPGSSHIAPSAGVFHASSTFYLLRTPNGWVVVTESTWLT